MKRRSKKILIAAIALLSAGLVFGAIDNSRFLEMPRHHREWHQRDYWFDDDWYHERHPQPRAREMAADIALRAAGISRDDISRIWVEAEEDDGFIFYEVDFVSGTRKYEYIVAPNGDILRYSWERIGRINGNRNVLISRSDAEDIARSVIGRPVETISVWGDEDDGRIVYECHALSGGRRCSVEILGNGEVLGFECNLRRAHW